MNGYNLKSRERVEVSGDYPSTRMSGWRLSEPGSSVFEKYLILLFHVLVTSMVITGPVPTL